jgi:hypothetical protein
MRKKGLRLKKVNSWPEVSSLALGRAVTPSKRTPFYFLGQNQPDLALF